MAARVCKAAILASPPSSPRSADGMPRTATVAPRALRLGSMACANRASPSRATIRRSCGAWPRVYWGRSSNCTSKKRVTGWPIRPAGWRQSSPAARASSLAPECVMPRMRPAPSSDIAASGSTSRNSGDRAKRSTHSLRVRAIRLASSMRRVVLLTRCSARFWLVFRLGELSKEMSSTAASSPSAL
ncbi:hypothetical protein D3C72_1205990 [compost metagenome]